MRLKQLDEIIELRRDINSITERLSEIKQMTQPKIQTISDMPRGGERKNVIEEYIVKSEKLSEKLENKKNELESKWFAIKELSEKAQLTQAQQNMIKARFYYAKPWKECVKSMRKMYPTSSWSEQKLFRMYYSVLSKFNKVSY